MNNHFLIILLFEKFKSNGKSRKQHLSSHRTNKQKRMTNIKQNPKKVVKFIWNWNQKKSFFLLYRFIWISFHFVFVFALMMMVYFCKIILNSLSLCVCQTRFNSFCFFGLKFSFVRTTTKMAKFTSNLAFKSRTILVKIDSKKKWKTRKLESKNNYLWFPFFFVFCNENF